MGDHAGGDAPEVGSLAEEAARLFGALHDAGAAAAGTHEHAADCTWCPVCRTVQAVRSLSPEVREHLASAATSLVHAAAGLLATAVPDADPEPDGDEQEEPA